ncbi:hypothetical protein C4N18_15485 (plasmid) [Fusobacterium varium ATCC 27725]|uniref:Uncharacterized protein n=2 Tax=Fusobacterium varium TaxID=856 RepID=A0ABN5JKD4_FUSVA|nr:hypothetical protein C4N18_15485 [Fusobacterium varium ATCC 27725]EES63530.1 hypothetical protein FVAG_02891 [Fusobacterium varium ATCC 27725]
MNSIMKVRDEYKKLIHEIVSEPKIKNIVYNVINEAILDEERRKAEFYMEHGRYPEHRDILLKLMYDLELNAKDRELKIKRAEMIGGTNV